MSDQNSKQSYTVSRQQLEALISKSSKEAVDHALIQNGNTPETFTHYSVSRPQLEKLLEKAGKEAVQHALIQNGNTPTKFTDK